MTIPELAQLLTASATLIASLGAVLASWRNGRKINVVEQKQDEQHAATNSRLTELLSVTGQQQRAVGHAEGLAAGRAERP